MLMKGFFHGSRGISPMEALKRAVRGEEDVSAWQSIHYMPVKGAVTKW